MSSTILSHAMHNRLFFIRAIHHSEFLLVSLTTSGPGGPVDIVASVGRKRWTKSRVDSIDSKDGSAAGVKVRDISIGVIGLAGVIFLFCFGIQDQGSSPVSYHILYISLVWRRAVGQCYGIL